MSVSTSNLPNMPTPKNGMIKTYDNAQRTFSRPYSAKNIFFYKSNDEYFQGVRVPVSKARYKTMDSLMDDLSGKIPLYFGVRRLYTPSGRQEIRSIDDLNNMGRPREILKNFPGQKVPRTKCYPDKWYPDIIVIKKFIFRHKDSPTVTKERQRRVTQTGTAPVVGSQQIKMVTFVCNGKPNKIYRMQFKAKRHPDFEDVLHEISEGLQVTIAKLFTNEGTRIVSVDEIVKGPSQLIACHKYERPILENSAKLPPIPPQQLSAKKRLTGSLSNSAVTQLPNISSANSAPTADVIKKNVRRRTTSRNKKKKSKQIEPNTDQNDSNEPIKNIDPELAGRAAVKIQSTFKGYSTRKKLQQTKAAKQRIDTIDSDLANNAAVKIQSVYKGYKVRKQYKRPKTAQEIFTPAENNVDFERQEKAAVKIQSQYKGYAQRQKYKIQKEMKQHLQSVDPQVLLKSTILLQRAFRRFSQRKKLQKEKQMQEQNQTIEKKNEEIDNKGEESAQFVALIWTGNRWGADAHLDLYLILCGKDGKKSEKIYLHPDYPILPFKQNQLHTHEIRTGSIDDLDQIIIGHSAVGYGAGIFVDYVRLEKGDRSKHFCFPCSMWFDTGQVDGKIERTLKCKESFDRANAKSSSSAESQRSRKSQQYTITVTIGDVRSSVPDAQASVYLACFGIETDADPICIIQTLSETYANKAHTFEIDCGNIGEIYKLRLESRNSNESKNLAWYLKCVDLKDYRTKDTKRLMYESWLSAKSVDAKNSNYQLFRELPVSKINRSDFVFNYNVTFAISKNLFGIKLPVKMLVQINGEFGGSGPCIVEIPKNDKNSAEHVVRLSLESVSLGRLSSVTCTIPSDPKGEYVSEGLSAISELYNKHGLTNLNGEEWLISKVVVRESEHTPYQYVFAKHRSFSSDYPGYVYRQVYVSKIEGLSTKINNKKLKSSGDGTWKFSITSGPNTSPLAKMLSVPYLTVYGDKIESDAIPLPFKKLVPNSSTQFKINLKGVGTIFKIRLQLKWPGELEALWHILQVRLKEKATGSEVRFPVGAVYDSSRTELFVEMPAVWPDIPPLPVLTYQIFVHTGIQSVNDTNFLIGLIVYGEKGDTGKRYLTSSVGTQLESCFKPGNVDSFELDNQVSMKKIHQVFVFVEPKGKSTSWFLDVIEVYDPDSLNLYKFECKRWFSDTKGDKTLECFLTPTEVVEDVRS